MTKERSITSFFKPVNARPRDGDDAKAEIVPLKKLKENMPMLEVQDGDEVKTVA